MLHAYYRTKVSQEVCFNDILLKLCNNENKRSDEVPYVGIEVSLTAVKVNLFGESLQLESE